MAQQGNMVQDTRTRKLIRPSTPDDPLRNRRLLAFIAAFHCFFVWPYIVAMMNKEYGVSDDLCVSMLHYMEIMSCGPIAAYFLAAHKKDGLMSIKDFATVTGNGMMDSMSSYSPRVIPGAEGSGAVAGD